MSYASFEKKWLGNHVDTDGVPRGAVYQCVDLAKAYMWEQYSVPMQAYGNAIDYWMTPHANILKKFSMTPGTSVKTGDVVVLKKTSTNPYGHIGIATGAQDGSQFELLEQNGGTGSGNGEGTNRIRKRLIPKSRIAGILRPKTVAKVISVVTPPKRYPRPVTAIAAANVRSAPRTSAPLSGSKQLKKGDVFTSVALVNGERVAGNNKWHKSAKGNYVWSGNTNVRS